MFVKIKICNGGVLERFCLQIFENLASQRDALFFIFNFPDSSVGKESACNAGDTGSIPGSGRSPGEGIGYHTPVSWPGEFHGLYSLWSCKESDTTERLSLSKGGTRTSVYREMDFDSTVENILSCQTVE